MLSESLLLYWHWNFSVKEKTILFRLRGIRCIFNDRLADSKLLAYHSVRWRQRVLRLINWWNWMFWIKPEKSDWICLKLSNFHISKLIGNTLGKVLIDRRKVCCGCIERVSFLMLIDTFEVRSCNEPELNKEARRKVSKCCENSGQVKIIIQQREEWSYVKIIRIRNFWKMSYNIFCPSL